MELSTELQFIAQQLIATRRGDQIRREDADRLEDIASNGHTTGISPRASADPALTADLRAQEQGRQL
jgi:hypothetical protein